jgi:hypothetical protein
VSADRPYDDSQPIAHEDLVANCRGVALAAFASVETIMSLLACDEREASAFKAAALDHFWLMRHGRC